MSVHRSELGKLQTTNRMFPTHKDGNYGGNDKGWKKYYEAMQLKKGNFSRKRLKYDRNEGFKCTFSSSPVRSQRINWS